MTRFNLLAFLRSAPNALLEEYFQKKGLLQEVDWTGVKEREADQLKDAILALPVQVQDDIMAEFQELHLRAQDGGFVKAVLDEARFHKMDPDLPRLFDSMRSHLERAFWCYLNRREKYWDGAHVIWRVDKLTNTNQWITRFDLPQRPGPVDEGIVADLKQALIDHFAKEARGRRCQVEAYRRDGEEIFYAYPEDYKKTVAEYVGDKLEPKTVQPTFEIVFRHVDAERRLDLHVEGDAAQAGALQVLFAKFVLKEEIEEGYDAARPAYVLQPLLSRHFAFTWPADLAIEQVAIKSLRFKVEEERWQRVTIEADPHGKHDAIYELLEKIIQGLPVDTLVVDQVTISVVFKKSAGDRRTPTRSATLTAPHTCRMVMDWRGEQIARMLEYSEIAMKSTPSLSDAPVKS